MDTINLTAPQVGMSGEYRAVLRNEDESVIYDSGWQSNLITDYGELIYADETGSGAWNSYCHIGSSGETPTKLDTTLGAWLARSSTVTVTDPANSYNFGTPTYQRWSTKTFRFTAGVGTGLVQEMGMGSSESNPSYLFSHHLLDTPINKAANNILDVSYRFTIWPSVIETTQSPILIDGVNYECLTSWYNLAGTAGNTFGEYKSANAGAVYDGVKSPPTGTVPSGDGANSEVSQSDTFATGSQRMYSIYGLTFGNTTLGVVKTATNRMVNFFSIQTEFSALDGGDIGGGIPKDGTKELTLIWTLTYGERP